MWGDVLGSDFGANSWDWVHEPTLPSEQITTTDMQVHAPHPAKRACDVRMTQTPQNLQARLESMCPSDLHLQGLRHFFDFVAICFHIIPVEANRWRTVFALLALESNIVHRLVSAVGLISLSSRGQTNLKATAYAQRSQSIRACEEIIDRGRKHRWRKQDSNSETLQVQSDALIVLATAILIGHLEQFDSGIAQESNQFLAVAEHVIVEVIDGKELSAVDTGPGSHFRFLTRIILWWDTFSRTMGVGPTGCLWLAYPSKIFAEVQLWEDVGGLSESVDEVLDSTQCVTGWPLDLLEGVARTTQLSLELARLNDVQAWSIRTKLTNKGNVDRCNELEDDAKLNSILFKAWAVETQLKSCRPRSIVQDSTPAAELRYIAFEILQAGAIIYYTRSLCCHMSRASKEIEQVLHFLGPTQPDVEDGAERRSARHTPIPRASMTPARTVESSTRRSGPISSGWNTSCAADGCVIWAYLQASIAAPTSQQSMCRSMLQRFAEIFQCGLVPLLLELNEEVWSRRKLAERSETDVAKQRVCCSLEEIWKDVRAQRRWKQLLLF
jgi:hypothetical protein